MKQSILDPPDPLGNETDFQKKTIALFIAYGWRVTHNYRSRVGGRGSAGGAGWRTTTSSPGFPDLLCLRPPDLVVLELKSLSGTATPEQRVWINGFAEVCGVEAYFVNPAHWPQLVDLARDGCEKSESTIESEQT